MKTYDLYKSLSDKYGCVCAICKEDITEELKKIEEFDKLNKEIKRKKKELQKQADKIRRMFEIKINIDHIQPKALGGVSRERNYQITHIECNTKKSKTKT